MPQSQLPAGDASSAAVASTSQSAGAVWNGVERRSQVDRRQQNRRQERGSAMLDTRTQPDRRCEARRQTDRAVNAFVACKV
ncbi:hypothetical protein NT239_11120 [Chitinibacter sp. SCUT-21]|uniref:hypothetical protein n=1 Tax=Chitinibacter sp. SCUT-21 TaxID=2970891 RepID=UPI0035A63716